MLDYDPGCVARVAGWPRTGDGSGPRWSTGRVAARRLVSQPVAARRGWPGRASGWEPDPYLPLPCRLYLIMVLDPRTNFTTWTVGYIGETSRRDVRIRFAEHVRDKPWSDTLPERDPDRALAAGVLVIGAAVYACKADAWVAEEAAIIRHRPLYNDEYNRDNPDRIPIYTARAARIERDRVAGVPAARSWATEHERRRRGDRPVVLTRWVRQVLVRRRSRRVNRRIVTGVVWAVVTLLLWVLTARYVPVLSVVRAGAVTAAGAGVGVLWWRRPRSGWTLAGNRVLRWLIVAAAGVVVWFPLLEWLRGRR